MTWRDGLLVFGYLVSAGAGLLVWLKLEALSRKLDRIAGQGPTA